MERLTTRPREGEYMGLLVAASYHLDELRKNIEREAPKLRPISKMADWAL